MANYNLFDAASLAMVPVGYKANKLYSVKPDNGDGDFTFTRSSAATRVNADGNIEKETQNLLLQSNSFDTTWSTNNASVTGGQSGYDGSSDAWKLEATSASGSLRQGISSSGVLSYSVYAKAGTADFIRLRFDGSTQVNIWFDLSNGSVGTNTNGIVGSIEDIGSGWYRVTAVANTSSLTQVRIYPAPNDAVGGSTGDNIYIQDAQLEQGLVARDYIETTTAAVEGGITDNVPRIDYTDGCGSLLLEPQRTNLITQSEYFGAWNNQEISVTDNATTSPEGVVNAASLVPTTNNDSHFCSYPSSPSLTSGQAYTQTYYVKANGYDFVQIHTGGVGMQSTRINYQLSTEEVKDKDSGISGTIEEFGNGWYKLTATRTAVGNGTASFNIGPVTSGSAARREMYTGNGTDGIYVYGAQLEAGSYATSYIPTYGSSVTRNADDMDTTYSTAITTDGSATFFIEVNGAPKTGSNSTSFNFGQEFASGDVISYNKSGADFHRIRVGANYFASTIKKDQPIKMAAVVTASSASVYANGVLLSTQSHTRDWSSATNLQTLISNAIGVVPVKQYILFPTALTDNECIALTRPYDTYQEWVDGEGLTWESKTCTTQNIIELQNL